LVRTDDEFETPGNQIAGRFFFNMSIATQTGDDGTTSLLFGRRVSKTDPRIVANGACDELNAALGMARACCGDAEIGESLLAIQRDLVDLMGEIATAEEDRPRHEAKGYRCVTDETVARLTSQIHHLEKTHRISFKHWATPGACKESACLDVARTVCRRAERAIIEVRDTGLWVNPEAIRYLNRVSDLCWLYGRWIETKLGLG
jgi:cob(I)alamin adenosyltransferase